MRPMIRVKPARERRVDFARWAVAQTPPIRTCSESEFAVPPRVFTHMPEELLIGAVVDGHPYVPVPPEPGPEPDPGLARGGVVTGSGPVAMVGESGCTPASPLPRKVGPHTPPPMSVTLPPGRTAQDIADSLVSRAVGMRAQTPPQRPGAADGDDGERDQEPATAPGEEEPAAQDEEKEEKAADGRPVCDVCGRDFASERGVEAHRRQAHRDETGAALDAG